MDLPLPSPAPGLSATLYHDSRTWVVHVRKDGAKGVRRTVLKTRDSGSRALTAALKRAEETLPQLLAEYSARCY
jgi:hypothetical protein